MQHFLPCRFLIQGSADSKSCTCIISVSIDMERQEKNEVPKRGSFLRALPIGLIVIAVILIGIVALTYKSGEWYSEQSISKIEVEGSNILSESEIMIMLKDSVLGKTYSEIDIANIDKMLLQNPYIIKTIITHDGKGKIHVEVFERQPTAILIKADGNLAYSDDSGFTFPYVPLDNVDNIPILGNLYLSGRLNMKALKMALKIVDEISNTDYDIIISRINFKSGTSFETITSDYGVKLIVDASYQLDEQLKKYVRFAAKNERTMMLSEVKYLDLRWSNRLVAGY
jgi:cell division septal protein FtsQ